MAAWTVVCLMLLVASAAADGATRKKSSKKRRRHAANGALAKRVSISLPHVGPDDSQPLAIHLPAASSTGGTVSNPGELMPHVSHAWTAVVAPHQAGLTEAKQTSLEAAPLSPTEAWHHYTAGLQGVVDSARLLIAFSIVPSLQLATGSLHAAAARGDVAGMRALLDSGAILDVDSPSPSCGSTALHFAAAVGSTGATKLLLDAGAAADAVGHAGASPLMVAAAMGHEGVASELCEGGADVNFAHAFGGSTALHFAAEMGRASLIAALCAVGADPNARKTTGGTPLHSAADADQAAAVTALVSATCNASTTTLLNGDTSALYLAAQRGYVNTSAALLDAGADVNFVMPRGSFRAELTVHGAATPLGAGGFYPERNTEVGNGASALHAAVENGHRAMVRLLLARGARQLNSMEGVAPLLLSLQYHHPTIAIDLVKAAEPPDVDARAPQDGTSALFVAAGEGYLEVVRSLLQLGATVDLANRHGATPLSHAAVRGQTKAMAALLAASGDPNLGAEGGGALHALLRGGSLSGQKLADAASMLLGAGASIEAAESGGVRPLMLAAARGQSAVCEALLAAGANVSAATPPPAGVTALMRAASGGHIRTLRLLLRAESSDPNQRAGSKMLGATALYLAAQHSHADAVSLLLEAGAHVESALDDMGTTTLFVAAERGCVACVRVLLAHRADVHAANWNGVNSAHMAAIRGHVGVLEALAEHTASSAFAAIIDSKALDGGTALITVAASNATQDEGLPPKRRTATLRWLLAAGADPRATRNDGFTPLLAAAAAGHPDAVAVLLEKRTMQPDGRGIDIISKATLPDGRNALTIAAGNGDLATVRALLHAGVAHDPRALELAVARREHELIALLSTGTAVDR